MLGKVTRILNNHSHLKDKLRDLFETEGPGLREGSVGNTLAIQAHEFPSPELAESQPQSCSSVISVPDSKMGDRRESPRKASGQLAGTVQPGATRDPFHKKAEEKTGIQGYCGASICVCTEVGEKELERGERPQLGID